MNFSEDNQNSAPGSVPAGKMGGARKGPDSQSTTKRCVHKQIKMEGTKGTWKTDR